MIASISDVRRRAERAASDSTSCRKRCTGKFGRKKQRTFGQLDGGMKISYGVTSPDPHDSHERPMTDQSIQVDRGEEHAGRGSFYIERDGRRVGELVYERVDE